MNDCHIQFETLCGLTASDPSVQSELADLRDHAEVCAICKKQLCEMECISEEVFLACALAEPLRGIPKAMRERFVERANQDGIGIRSRVAGWTAWHGAGLAAFGLLVMVFAVAFSWRGSESGRDVIVASSHASTPFHDGSGETLQGEHADFRVRRARVGRGLARLGRSGSHGTRQIAGSAASGSAQHDAGGVSGSKISEPDFVMYSPRPNLSSNSPLAMIGLHTAFGPWFKGEPGGFDRAFTFEGQKVVLEASSSAQQATSQYAYLAKGIQNFKFNPAGFELQFVSH